MKRFFVSLVACIVWLSNPVQAQQFIGNYVNLDFNDVQILDFIHGTYGKLLKKDYVLDPSIRTSSEKVTLKMRDVEVDKLRYVVDSIVKNTGIEIGTLNGALFFHSKSKSSLSMDPVLADATTQSDFNPLIPSVPVSVLEPQSSWLGSTPGIPSADAIPTVRSLPDVLDFYEPRARLPEQLQVIADAILGTAGYRLPDRVILAGSQENVDRARKLIQQYDGVPGEVLARALVFEFSESTDKKSGFQIAALALAEKLQIGINTVLQPFSNLIRYSGRDITAVLTAVSGDSRFSLVSAPSVRVLDGSTGRLSVGQEVPVLASTELDRDGRAIQSVQYRSSGVLFDLTPRIMRDRMQVKLSQQLSSFQQTSTSQIDSPTLQKREISTTVSLMDGEIVILGGLDETKNESSSSGLWFLPRFLNSNADLNQKSQILVVLQVNRIS